MGEVSPAIGDFESSLFALVPNGTLPPPLHCPSTCRECPGWEGSLELGRSLWLIVLLTSLSSPIAVWLCLPFIRGDECKVCGSVCCTAAAPPDDVAEPEEKKNMLI